MDKDKKAERLFDYSIFLSHYGRDSQLILAIEEMATLTQEITKGMRGMEDKLSIVESIAYVEIMMEMLKIVYSANEKSIDAVKTQRIDRIKSSISWELSYREFKPSTEEEF